MRVRKGNSTMGKEVRERDLKLLPPQLEKKKKKSNPTNSGAHQKPEKSRKHSSRASERMQPYAQFGFRASDLKNCKVINYVVLSDQVYGDLLQEQQEINTVLFMVLKAKN